MIIAQGEINNREVTSEVRSQRLAMSRHHRWPIPKTRDAESSRGGGNKQSTPDEEHLVLQCDASPDIAKPLTQRRICMACIGIRKQDNKLTSDNQQGAEVLMPGVEGRAGELDESRLVE